MENRKLIDEVFDVISKRKRNFSYSNYNAAYAVRKIGVLDEFLCKLFDCKHLRDKEEQKRVLRSIIYESRKEVIPNSDSRYFNYFFNKYEYFLAVIEGKKPLKEEKKQAKNNLQLTLF